jgi:hypothetical protein
MQELEPRCPHCWRPFPTWSLCKIHVKRCPKGLHPRPSVRQSVSRRARSAAKRLQPFPIR